MQTRLITTEPSRYRRSTLALSLSLALGACASLPSTESTAPATAPVPSPVAAGAPVQAVEVADDLPPENVAEGINREGRVVQLGRFSETPPAGTPPANDVVELNYEQEDLRLVFEQLGDALGINLVIDPSIDFRVSVRTSAANPLRYDDIWPLMRALARSAGVTIEQSGNVYQFRLDASRVPSELVLPEFLDQATASEVLQVTPLRYISVEAAEVILTPLLQPEGSVMRLGGGNLLGISGTPQELSRVNALLAVVDDDPFQNQGIRLYELNNSKASEVAEELTGVLQLIEGEQPSYQVLGLDRVNAVLVVAPANRGFTEVDRWVGLLDASSQGQVEQLFVYKVKNLDAVALGETLNDAFGQESNTERRPAREERPFSSPLVPTAQSAETAPAQPFEFQAQAQTQTNAQNDNTVSADLTVTIVADENTNSILVRATPREYRQLLSTISSLDRVPAQVLIQAVIGQVTLTDSTKFGIDWSIVSANLGSGSANTSTNFLPNLIDEKTNQITPGSGLVFTRIFTEGSAAIEATLNAIAKDNDVRLLSRPTILALNKQEGAIKVGQNVPVNNGSTVTNNGTTQNIAYTDVGIELTITPQINDDGYISMEIQQRLSSVQGTTVGVANNPTFSNQEITTSVVVADQNTIALGGLIQEENSNLQSGVPFLMSIPGAGRLFSYTDNTQERRELFVILRPQIIYGDARDTAAMQTLRDSFREVKKLFEESGF